MPKRCIGIDIGRSHLRAVQVAKTSEGLCLERTFGVQMRRSTDSLPEILRSLTANHGFDRRADVAIALPHHLFFFADVEVDAAGLADLKDRNSAGLKDHFPIATEEVVSHVCSVMRFADGRHSVLVAATSVESLREELRLLEEGRMRPARADTPITAAHTAVLANHPESARGLAAVLYVDESTLSLAVTHDASILLVRNIPMVTPGDQDFPSFVRETAEIVAQEIEITWRRLFGNAPDAGMRLFLIASDNMTRRLARTIPEKINCRTIAVNPYATVRRGQGVDAEFPLCIAEGLAIRSLQGDPSDLINFLPAYHARTRPKLRLRKELAICGMLAGTAAAVWIIGLFLQLSSLESNYAALKRQSEEIFRRTVPTETNVVNPKVQLQQKLDSFHEDCQLYTCFSPGRPEPLAILYALSRHVPAGGELKLHDVLIAGDSVRVMGSCDSFAAWSRWQKHLERIPGLQVADPPNPKKDPDSGRVLFTVSLASTRERT